MIAAFMCILAGFGAEEESFVPIEGMTLVGPVMPGEAVTLAITHFTAEVARMTGQALPVMFGAAPADGRVLIVGNRSDSAAALIRTEGVQRDDDIAKQSYQISLLQREPGRILAAGLGDTGTARGYLGLSYALGELLRRLDLRDGRWGFTLPAEPIVSSPKMPNRSLYIMNSASWSAAGLSLDYEDKAAIEAYVNAIIDARYSRISLWQWYHIYLYPGNFDERRADNQRIHRGMRHLFEYARRRGLEAYHMLTPIHANPDLLPNDPKFAATGYYGRTSICWSQPEGRAMARNVAQHEMEYYGPVDGYIVWFYDPGGCFCADCRKNQGKNLFEQLMLVSDLAKTISPGAQLEACLWPTWCFHEPQWGINFPREDVKAFVHEFLEKALAQFGPRNLTIMDSCDSSFTNYEFVIYDGTVKPDEFKRNAFMHRVLGTPGEASYPFSPFKFRYIADVMGMARGRGLEEALFSAIYIGSTFPSVFACADTLWEDDAASEATLRRCAASMAKGEALEPFVAALTALEDLDEAKTYAAKDAALVRAETAWKAVEASSHFYARKDWMSGYLEAHRRYLEMARAKDEEAYAREFELFRKNVGAYPMYADYVRTTFTAELCGKMHVPGYWRGAVGDTSTIGSDGAELQKWIGVPDAKL